MRENMFWENIRKLAQLDHSVAVPESVVQGVYGIFQPSPQQEVSRQFRLRPLFAGAVRKGETTQKFFYELDDERFVSLELGKDREGIHLHGFINGISDPEIVLYGEEGFHVARESAGAFEVAGLPAGKYHLSLTEEGETFWISNLVLEDSKEA